MNRSVVSGRMSRWLVAVSLIGGIGSCLRAEETKEAAPPGVQTLEVQPSGTFVFDGVDFSLMHFTPEWVGTPQGRLRPASGFPRLDGETWEVKGGLAIRGTPTPLEITERLTKIGPHALGADYVVKNSEGIATREMALQVALPLDLAAGRALTVGGEEVALPAAFSRRQIFEDPIGKEQLLVLPSATGTLEIKGVFSVLIQDQRQWKQDGGYTVRLRFARTDDPLQKAALQVTVRHSPWRSDPVSLAGPANRGFADETPNDRKGGWTDQGPVNDLAAMPAGRLNAAGVAFEIADPQANDGKAAIVIGRSSDEGLPKAATIPVPGNPVWRNIYLLHAGAWMPKAGQPVGTLRVRYTDGTESAAEVQAGRDVGNWWSPSALPNGVVGWTGVNASCPLVGLYVSRFPLKEKPVAEITLAGSGNAMWMVAGVSGSPDDLKPLLPSAPFTAAAGADWAPYAYSLEIEPGSVFDFSALNDAPAGKYGPLKATPDGHFEFADQPGRRVRLWGVNLCFSANYLEPEESERLAARLAASGYNTVRLHHFDRDLSAKGQPSYELDPAQLDKLDALFAALKRHGLSVTIDLFTSRSFTAQEKAGMGMDPKGEIAVQFKTLVPISDVAFENWKQYARNLLTHKNPYTGLTWAEDPALIAICPVNEDPLEAWIDRAPAARKLYDKAFADWWKDAANRGKAGDDREKGFPMFLLECQIASDARRAEFLRSLGVKALLTGVNFHSEQELAFAREHYDYVDNHQYWDHPEFPAEKWQEPFRFSQASAVRSVALAPRDTVAARLWGKPYMMTEFNFVKPNRYRAEGGVFMPAYASLQDWDGLYNFDYAAHRASVLGEGGTAGTFSISTDPIGLLADRVSAVIFRRGDIAAGKGAIGYAVRSPAAFGVEERNFPPAFSRIGLLTRIGSGTGGPEEQLKRYHLDAIVAGEKAVGGRNGAAPIFHPGNSLIDQLEQAGILPADSVSEEGTRFLSDTGEIELRSKEGAMKVVTPRSELFVMPPGQYLEGAQVAVTNGPVFGTVSVLAVDGKPLAESHRLLVTHLTDALATGTKFAGQDRRLLEEHGSLPLLVQAGQAELTLKLDPARTWHAWAVDMTGKRIREIALQSHDGAWELTAQTVTGKDVQLAYEIAADPKE